MIFKHALLVFSGFLLGAVVLSRFGNLTGLTSLRTKQDACEVGIAGSVNAGLNLPPRQGSSNSGAFSGDVLPYDYTPEEVAGIKPSGFDSIRLPINVPTSKDPDMMAKLKSYLDVVDGSGILCMFDDSSNDVNGDGHGDGRVNNIAEMTAAWKRVHEAFADYPNVMYEIFNEPFGYADATEYYLAMISIVSGAGLPTSKVMLAGISYSSNVQALANLGWQGYLAYHIYNNWLPDGQRTQSGYSNKLQSDLAGLSCRVFITEFGAALNYPNPDYSVYDDDAHDGNVNLLRGLSDALLYLAQQGQGVRGAFHWHGWHNGDSYDFWDAANTNGAHAVQRILQSIKEDLTVSVTSMSRMSASLTRRDLLTTPTWQEGAIGLLAIACLTLTGRSCLQLYRCRPDGTSIVEPFLH